MRFIVSDTNTILIRQAHLSDDARLAAFTRQVFQETYGGSIPAHTLALYLDEHLSPLALARDIAEARTALLIAAADRTIHATARLAWHDRPNCVKQEAAIELGRFYIEASQRGTGLSDLLLAACERKAADMNATHIWLCAWEHNPRALAFYQRNKFSIVGKAIVMVGNIAFQDHVLLKALS